MKHGNNRLNNRFSVVTAAMAALAITEKIEGTIKVDVNNSAFADAGKIPLLKVPTALEFDTDSALDLSAVPSGWRLKKKTKDGSVHYYLTKGLAIFLR